MIDMKEWQSRRARWNWRAFLTAEERATIERSDAALLRLEKARERYNERYGVDRAAIVNRAIQRAKFKASR